MNIGNIGLYNNQINKSEDNAKSILNKIATLQDISSTDGASQMIMDSMRNEFSTISQGIQNANEFTGMLRIADNTLQNMSKGADNLQSLAVRYNNDALNSDQKAMLKKEAHGIMQSMNDGVKMSTYNGQSVFRSDMKVFDGQSTITANIQSPNMSKLDIEDQDSIQSFQDSIHSSLSSISGTQKQLESSQNVNYKALVSYSSMYNDGFDLANNVVTFEKEKLLNQAAHFANSMNTDYIKKQALSLLQ